MIVRKVKLVMRYSNVIITDENFDEEMERLADQNNYNYSQCIGFAEKLSDDFIVQQNDNGYEEWVCQKVYPDFSIDCVAPIIEAVVAYEFANGFMLFYDISSFSIFDSEDIYDIIQRIKRKLSCKL